MENENNTILNKIFTKNTIKKLIEDQEYEVYTKAIYKYVKSKESKRNRDIISEFYSVIKKEYRNEYYYKNTLLNKLLLGKHSVKTTTALTEIPIGKSKADFILINGRAIVYEIKTELDTFERLRSQINDYYKAFTNVSVITCEANYIKLSEILKNTNVGISILTNRGNISERKKAIEDHSNLQYETIFKVLRKQEFESILKIYYGKLPQTTKVKYYDECFAMFTDIPIDEAHRLMVSELKKRGKTDIDKYKQYVPRELSFIAYFGNYKREDYKKLNSFLNNNSNIRG